MVTQVGEDADGNARHAEMAAAAADDKGHTSARNPTGYTKGWIASDAAGLAAWTATGTSRRRAFLEARYAGRVSGRSVPAKARKSALLSVRGSGARLSDGRSDQVGWFSLYQAEKRDLGREANVLYVVQLHLEHCLLEHVASCFLSTVGFSAPV